jgi:hypothetical protein
MKHIKTFESFLNITESTGTDKYHLSQDDLENFLKSLNSSTKVQMPMAIRDGEIFNKTASKVITPKDAIKNLSHYKGEDGNLTAIISGVVLKDGDRELLNQLQISIGAFDAKRVIQHGDNIGKVYISFEYENFDKDAHAKSVRGMSLD